MNKISLSIFVLLLFTVVKLQAQEKWALIQDLNSQWLYFDGEWLPVTDRFDTYDGIFFRVENISPGHHLMIEYPDEFAVFLNEKIYYSARDSLMINLDSLYKAVGNRNPLIMIYASKVKPANLRTQLLLQYDPANEPVVSNVINVIRRKTDDFRDAAVIAFLFLMVSLVLLKTFYSRNLGNFYDVRKTLSSRDTDEDFLRGRLFSQVNLLIMVFQCLIMGLFLLLLFVSFNSEAELGGYNMADYFWIWLRYSLIIAGFIFLKFILIKNFTSLYNINGFSTPHFMSYLRMLSIVFGIALVAVYLAYFALNWQDPEAYENLLNLILFILGAGILVMFFKLLNSVSYKKLHLFSYLCATEILPYVVILKVAINQSI